MTLASRLSTQANLGFMDNRKEQWSLIFGNLALIQVKNRLVIIIIIIIIYYYYLSNIFV